MDHVSGYCVYQHRGDSQQSGHINAVIISSSAIKLLCCYFTACVLLETKISHLTTCCSFSGDRCCPECRRAPCCLWETLTVQTKESGNDWTPAEIEPATIWGQEPLEQTSALWTLYLLLEDSSIDSKALRLVFKALNALALQHLSDLLSAYEPLSLSGHLTQACLRIKVKCGEASFTFNAAVSGAAARWPQMCPSVDLI